jgi:SpoIIAA-like
MIKFELLRDAGVLVVEPKSALSAENFSEISRTIDPYIREKGKLSGLFIDAPSFPGWDSFGALFDHMKFVYDHHRNIDRVAAVTDSAFLKIAPKIAEHFAHPEIKVFPSGEKDRALGWLKTGT